MRNDTIQEIIDIFNRDYPTASGETDEFFHDVLNVLRNAKSEWVSVKKDGLPEPYKAVLVYGKVGDMVNWKVDYITECGMWANSFTVTHWRYLPELPKEDDAE